MSRKTTPTYVLLNQITLAASSSEVTFSNIPQNYADLVLVTKHTHPSNYGIAQIRLNGDSGNNYNHVLMSGKSWSPTTFSAATSNTNNAIVNFTGSDTSSIISSITNIFDYSASDKHKSILTRTNGWSSSQTWNIAIANRWANNSPITRVSLASYSGYTAPFATGSTFSLYGLVA